MPLVKKGQVMAAALSSGTVHVQLGRCPIGPTAATPSYVSRQAVVDVRSGLHGCPNSCARQVSRLRGAAPAWNSRPLSMRGQLALVSGVAAAVAATGSSGSPRTRTLSKYQVSGSSLVTASYGSLNTCRLRNAVRIWVRRRRSGRACGW